VSKFIKEITTANKTLTAKVTMLEKKLDVLCKENAELVRKNRQLMEDNLSIRNLVCARKSFCDTFLGSISVQMGLLEKVLEGGEKTEMVAAKERTV